MASSDSIMMDSPAQTPDTKGQVSGSSAQAAADAPADVVMAIDGQTTEASGWDTKKWREDVQVYTSRLQHGNWNPVAKYRDPMSKPLVTQPNALTPEVDSRLRQYYQQQKSKLEAA